MIPVTIYLNLSHTEAGDEQRVIHCLPHSWPGFPVFYTIKHHCISLHVYNMTEKEFLSRESQYKQPELVPKRPVQF